MVTESWFRNWWKTSKKPYFHSEKAQIGVLAFEAASLMSKLLRLWHSLSEKEVARLRAEIVNSLGIKKLVSEDDDYVGKLICAEITENLAHVARAVARLSKKCNDPLLKSFEQAFNDLIKFSIDSYNWQFSWKKMDEKIKKMERFIFTNTCLFQEMETLADLEQSLKRMKSSDNSDSIVLVEYEKKVSWKKQDVKHIKENSLWNRTYDYTILLLARSIFTIYGRIGHVFGTNQVADYPGAKSKDSNLLDSINTRRVNHSNVFTQSSVYPSENCAPRYSNGSLGKILSYSGPISRTNNTRNFHSGPLQNSTTASSPISARHNGVDFNSGPISKSTTKSGPFQRAKKSTLKLWQFRDSSRDAKEKKPHQKNSAGPFTGCINGENGSPPSNRHTNSIYSGALNGTKESSYGNPSVTNPSINSKNKLLNAPPDTLGAAALSLHYANLIIFIEKLVSAPHLIGNDARDDLYHMLPNSIRASLRAKLKPFANSLTSSAYDPSLADEWNDAMSATLEWLGPLAHSTIRWQSERSFEHQNLGSRANVLLVQTLFFANQEKTEEAITDVLVGLNYIWRFGRDINVNSLVECGVDRKYGESLDA